MTHKKHYFVIGLVAALAACNRANNSSAAGEEAQRGAQAAPQVPADTLLGNGGNGAGGGGSGATSGRSPMADDAPTGNGATMRRATAEFSSVPKIALKGEATLQETPTGVKILITVEKAPAGDKAVHIHQKGDCSNIAGKSMGDHFAPNHEHHGLPGDKQRHPGDLGNLTVGADGKGRLELSTDAGNLKSGDPMSFIGRSIVIHESKDKGTQPSGDSGTPMACAVIQPTNGAT